MSQHAPPPEGSPREDTYYLDSRRALAEARAACTCPLPDGRRRPRYCFHPGPNPPDAPDNLIALPFKDFIAYFLQHPDAIPSTIDCNIPGLPQDQRRQVSEDFALLRAELLQAQRAAAKTTAPMHHDTYFLDPAQALATARQRNQIEEGHPRIKGLQICYHSGPAIEASPENLIHIPEDQLLDFLCNTRLRLPSRIVYPPQASLAQQQETTATFIQLIDTARQYRKNAASELHELCRAQRPVFDGAPLRIFLPACRLTEVMQYCSKNLAVAFERLGHHARLTMEQNAMELLPSAWIFKEQFDFQPHVVININHLNNSWLHPEVFNVVWWQDPMAEIMQGNPLPWRERDLVFSVDPFFDEYIHRTGAREILRQHFCVNAEIFRPDHAIRRQHKLVFLGSAYHDKYNSLDQPTREFVLQAMQRLEQGELIPATEVNRHIPDHTLAHWVYNFIIRDSMVRWACEMEEVPVDGPYLSGGKPCPGGPSLVHQFATPGGDRRLRLHAGCLRYPPSG